MSDITLLLKKVGELQGDSILDVGTRDFRYAKEFLELGFAHIEALDPTLPEGQTIPTGIMFHKTKLEDFVSDRKFDIVVCRHVIPFTDNVHASIEKLLSLGKIVVFTVFGPHDPWADKVKTIPYQELVHFLKDQNIRYRSEEYVYAKTYAGEEKLWHIHTIIVKTEK